MNWFDILKLGGEDLDGVQYNNLENENPIHDYDDREESGRIGDHFYNLKDQATTRPHFEHQAKKPKMPSVPIEGNLKEIVDRLDGVGTGTYYSFSDENNDAYVVTYMKKDITSPYEKTFVGLTPKKLDNESSVIAFDSVYPTNQFEILEGRGTTFKPIWNNDDERLKRFKITPEERQKLQARFKKLTDEVKKKEVKLDKTNCRKYSEHCYKLKREIKDAKKEMADITMRLGSDRNRRPSGGSNRRRRRRW